MSNKSIESVFNAVDSRMKTARFGLEDIGNPNRAHSGFYNAVVFGRMTTFALQNLRNIVTDFDEWYRVEQEKMKADPLMRYFYELRTQIEKKADSHLGAAVHIKSFSGNDMKRFLPAPPGAGAFFIGDQNGGSGWEIKNPDGTVDNYYIDLPPDIGEVTLHLPAAPEQYRSIPMPKLVATYLDKLDELIAKAKEKFVT